MAGLERIAASSPADQILHREFNHSIHGDGFNARLLEAGVVVGVHIQKGRRGNDGRLFYTLKEPVRLESPILVTK